MSAASKHADFPMARAMSDCMANPGQIVDLICTLTHPDPQFRFWLLPRTRARAGRARSSLVAPYLAYMRQTSDSMTAKA